jgi:hypothetical protein
MQPTRKRFSMLSLLISLAAAILGTAIVATAGDVTRYVIGLEDITSVRAIGSEVEISAVVHEDTSAQGSPGSGMFVSFAFTFPTDAKDIFISRTTLMADTIALRLKLKDAEIAARLASSIGRERSRILKSDAADPRDSSE